MPFSFNAVKLCVVIINEKPWTCGKQVCKALSMRKQPGELSGTTILEKIFSINISWWP